jgi:hypothetical protein
MCLTAIDHFYTSTVVCDTVSYCTFTVAFFSALRAESGPSLDQMMPSRPLAGDRHQSLGGHNSRRWELVPWILVPPFSHPSLHHLSNQRLRTISGLHVVYCPSNILNILHYQYPIDHRCLGRLRKSNWDRPFQESVRCRHRMRKVTQSYPRTAPRTREGIQGLSGRKSEVNQLPHPGGERHPGVLGHSRRSGHPGKFHVARAPSGNSFNVTSPGPIPTGQGLVCWDRCPPLCLLF